MSILGFNSALSKQPSEQVTIKASFNNAGNALAVAGYSFSNCELKVYDRVGADTGNNLIQGNATIDANNSAVFVCFKSGTDGHDYYGRFKTGWTKNNEPDQIIERDLLIQVRQKGF